jgi:transposase
MSLRPQVVYLVPEETARVARAAFPKGNVYMRMHDELGMFYQDLQFVPLFSTRGQPAEAPARLALVLVMQFAENLTDRQAADAVRSRLDWKFALGLELTDPGFDYSVLSEFRSRLITGEAEDLLLDTMLDHFKARGLIKPRGRQRTDSTHVLAAIRSLNRLELVGRTLQHALTGLAQEVPDWLVAQISPDWFDRYSRQLDEYRLPKSEPERRTLAEVIGNDGLYLLGRLDATPGTDRLRTLPAVETLKQVWAQQYEAIDERVRWRNKDDLPPSAERIASPHDTEARYSTKRSVTWVGYKVHLSETCDDNLPHLITHVGTTVATDADIEALGPIHQALAERDRLPSEHLVDAAYGSAQVLVTSQTDYDIDVICPVPPDTSWQAQDKQAFVVTDFSIDWEKQTVVCPNGRRSHQWTPGRGPRGKPTIQVQFRHADCRACPMRVNCTRSKLGARELTLHPEAEHLALQAARERQQTDDFKRQYARRSGVEGTVSQSAYALGMRRSRYIGLARTHLQHVLTAAAMNLTRVAAWMQEVPHSKTRRSHFAALSPA